MNINLHLIGINYYVFIWKISKVSAFELRLF